MSHEEETLHYIFPFAAAVTKEWKQSALKWETHTEYDLFPKSKEASY